MEKRLKIVAIVSFIILVAFFIKALMAKNFEFLGYWVAVTLLFFIVVKLADKFNFHILSVILFSLWAFSHMAGGLIYIGETRLYDLMLINIIGEPYNILRFDQVIHAFCYFAISILTYSVLKNYIKNLLCKNKGGFLFWKVFLLLS